MVAEKGALRGRVKVNLIRELALGAKTKAELRREVGVSEPAFRAFEQRHAQDITAVREDLENKWAGLWVAKQSDRIAEIQQLIEDLSEQVEREVASGGLSNHTGVPLAKLLLAAYQQVAVELGQVPRNGQAVEVTPPTVIYNYGGFAPQSLGLGG